VVRIAFWGKAARHRHVKLILMRNDFHPCATPREASHLHTSSVVNLPVSALHTLWVRLAQLIPPNLSYRLKIKGLSCYSDWHFDCFINR
jgi:hypothetical protein